MKVKYAAVFHEQISSFAPDAVGLIYYIEYDGNYNIRKMAIGIKNALSDIEKQLNPREYNFIGMKSKFPVFKKR